MTRDGLPVGRGCFAHVGNRARAGRSSGATGPVPWAGRKRRGPKALRAFGRATTSFWRRIPTARWRMSAPSGLARSTDRGRRPGVGPRIAEAVPAGRPHRRRDRAPQRPCLSGGRPVCRAVRAPHEHPPASGGGGRGVDPERTQGPGGAGNRAADDQRQAYLCCPALVGEAATAFRVAGVSLPSRIALQEWHGVAASASRRQVRPSCRSEARKALRPGHRPCCWP